MKKKYVIRARISERIFWSVLRLFCLDIEAAKAAVMTGLSRNSIEKIFVAVRHRLSLLCASERKLSTGVYEFDENYFGAYRIRGVRGRGAQGKTIVFGILKRSGNVNAFIVNECSEKTLMPIIKQVIALDSTIYTDGFTTYCALGKHGYQKHFSVNHDNNEFARNGVIHTNGIEGFGGFCKARLAKFRGMSKRHFELHLNECEYRYNHRHEDIHLVLINEFRKNHLKLS